MSRGENSVSIRTDLINEIFSRLPTKSVARFSCLSKQWRDMLSHPYFKELFSTRSSARPHLLFLVKRNGYDLCLFSSPQPRNPYERSSSLVVTADFRMILPKHLSSSNERHAFGLFVLRVHYKGVVICNPSTGQLALLPVEEQVYSTNYLLFDPVDKQFKVLSTKFYNPSLLLTLGTGDDTWEEIYCPLNPLSTYDLPEGICINGVLYYFAESSHLIVWFDVRSEEFKFIYKDFFERERKTYREFIRDRDSTKMINYKGKLGVITLKYDYNPWDGDPNNSKGRRCALKLCMSVLRDADDPNSEWPEHVYTFWKTNECVGCSHISTIWENQIVARAVSVAGVTATCDIVLSMKDASKPFCVFYLNIERNTLQRVEFRTGPDHEDVFEKCSSNVTILSVDHVEDLNFMNMETTYEVMQLLYPRRKPTRAGHPTSS